VIAGAVQDAGDRVLDVLFVARREVGAHWGDSWSDAAVSRIIAFHRGQGQRVAYCPTCSTQPGPSLARCSCGSNTTRRLAPKSRPG